MTRFFLFVIFLIPLMLAGDWLLQNQGNITIVWFDTTIEISTALAAFIIAAGCMIITAAMLLLWQLATWPERVRARKRYRTLARGLAHVTQGFTALALGDETAAMAALKKARKALPNEPLPQLLSAQVMQRQGKHEEARGFLRALMKHESTAQLATHKLIEQHMTRREWPEAIALAEPAQRDMPRDRWLVLTLIDLYAHVGNTAGMLALTEGWHFRSPLSRAERHRIAAIAHFMIAGTEHEPRLARQQWQQAVNYAPDFLPAILAYTSLLSAYGEARTARKILRNAWNHHATPILIPAILQSVRATKTPSVNASERQQTRLLSAFLREPLGAAHQVLQAQYQLSHGHFEEAKTALEAALALEENKQTCQLMAEVERELRGSAAANGWMARAMDAPLGESWICSRCGHAHTEWQLHCAGCESFDSLRYERPEARITSVQVAVQ